MVMINEELWKRTTWKNKNIEFLFACDIVEYDLKSAGLNLCKQYELLPIDTIKSLENMDKKAQVKKLGLIQRNDKEFTKKLLVAFEDARKWFITSNELTEDKILCTKKDAIFVIDSYIKHSEDRYLRFIPKNKYSSYLYLNKYEFYVNTDMDIIDIKGLGQGEELDRIRSLHGDYMLKFLYKFCSYKEKMINYKIMIKEITDFIRRYRSRELPIEYYRQLNKYNCYELWDSNMNKFIQVSDTDRINDINIGYNYINYVLPLANMYI